MKFIANIKFEYNSGRFRKVSLLETDPTVVVEEVDGEVTERRPATAKDVAAVLRKSFATMMRNGTIRSFSDHETGNVIVVRFASVDDVEIEIVEVTENAQI